MVWKVSRQRMVAQGSAFSMHQAVEFDAIPVYTEEAVEKTRVQGVVYRFRGWMVRRCGEVYSIITNCDSLIIRSQMVM